MDAARHRDPARSKRGRSDRSSAARSQCGRWADPPPDGRAFAASERMGLASADGPGRWTLRPDAETVLRDLAVRGDIIKTMHRAMTGQGQERAMGDYVIETAHAPSPVIGRLIETGLHDELSGQAYAVIDGVDGRIHHVRFAATGALANASPPGGLVEVRRFDALMIGLSR